jgi:hypothetical protein
MELTDPFRVSDCLGVSLGGYLQAHQWHCLKFTRETDIPKDSRVYNPTPTKTFADSARTCCE